ncbi:hypothetical protein Dsin_005287 [Dipteronia sinensis]|uniref:CCHC-type domain-containing protein n=1 Tax=Dipteronia sinensis TaxID=43782 RepID=A0AAE0AX27_9ROSI|nr:hypothetical protein Dsin_005287 [Dipteronia sinensis]
MITYGASPISQGTRTVPWNDVPRPFTQGYGAFPSGVKYVDSTLPGGLPYGPAGVPLAEPSKDKWIPRGKKGSAQDYAFQLPKRTDTGKILVIGGTTPQFWPDIISLWENDLLAAFKSESREFVSAFDLWDWCETFLDPYSKLVFNTFKGAYPDKFAERIGSPDDINVTNFTMLVRTLLVGPEGGHPDTSHKQLAAQVKLERLSCEKTKHIVPFSLDYYAFSTDAGLSMSKTAAQQYMLKLPGHVGQAIRTEWDTRYGTAVENDIFLHMVPPRITFTFNRLREMCIERAKTKEIAKSDYSFCSSIYTGYSHMDQAASKKKKKQKAKKKSKTAKSCAICTTNRRPRYKARKSPLKGKDLKKNKPKAKGKVVRNKKRCYSCGQIGHISPNCPNKGKPRRINILLDLVSDLGFSFASATIDSDDDSIASDVSDTDSVYSIVSIHNHCTCTGNNSEAETSDSSEDTEVYETILEQLSSTQF